jgi:hypothetical protein
VVSEHELMPHLYWEADAASMRGQAEAVKLSKRQLSLLVLAPVGSLANWHLGALNWPPLLAILLLLGAAYYALLNHHRNPQALWYEGRAVAESLKTITWKYAVRADPFSPIPGALNADEQYRLQLADILYAFRKSEVIRHSTNGTITPAMRTLRAASLTIRRDDYLNHRIRPQREWYHSRAARCRMLGRRAELAAALLPALAVIMLLLNVFDASPVHLTGTFSAAAAAVAAWAHLRQYRPLAAAYRVAADELTLIRVQLVALDVNGPNAEAVWARLARDAEDAVSREHTTWQARREMRS